MVTTATKKKPAAKKPAARRSPAKKPSSTASSRSSSGRGGRSKGSGGGSGGAGGRVIAAFREHVGNRRADAYGLGLILLGVISGFAIYAGAAGPVGGFLEATWRGLFGVFGLAVPVVLVWFGGMVVMDKPAPTLGRIGVGTALIAIAVLGGWQLWQGHPHPTEGIKELWPAAGLAGWAIATPLEAGLSLYGAQAAFVVLVVLGLLIVTATPLSSVLAVVTNFLTAVPETTDPRDKTSTRAKKTKAAAADPKPSKKASTRAAKDAKDEVEVEKLVPVEISSPASVIEEPAAIPTRAVLAATGVQDPLDGLAEGQNQADHEAGRAPAPPRPLALTADGKLKATAIKPIEDWDEYQLPPLDLLATGRTMKKESERHIEAQTAALQETFDQFNIDAQVARWSRGPTVTRFEIELGPGVQVKKVANMGDDIAYALAAPDVRIVAPIPGKSAIGVEVPNRQRDLITLGDILRSDTAKANDHPLYVALGVDIAGNPAMVNLATMPHLLVAGATGSGKSVTLNAMLSSIIMRTRPDQVRMILIDPKRVELNAYNGAPHLLSPVVTDAKRATDAVQWCVKEMEMRYEMLARLGFRNIDGYNEAVDDGEVPQDTEETFNRLPYILLVIDELADLMLVAARDVEDAICRIAQMARAVGIHMVIATQRPSVDVITGLIKANIPSRLALAVSSGTDSRTILDANGAEKLVGHGDMLFLPASQGKPSRLQGCFISEKEILPVIEFCKRQREVEYVDAVVKTGEAAVSADISRGGDDTDEALLVRAAGQVVDSGLGSVSMLQRKLRIGFARAGRLMDELEEIGVVGPNEGSKARDVLWTPDMFDQAKESNLFADAFSN